MASKRITASEAHALIAAATVEISSDDIGPRPLVSVIMVTYNHERFLREAVESVLAQRTDFAVELVIADDASTDGTSEIALVYQRNFPTRVRVLLARQNLGQHTGNGRLNTIRALASGRGEYFALLEGDDVWIDPFKLQRQVDLLRNNPGNAGTFHETARTEKDGDRVVCTYPDHDLDEVDVPAVVLSRGLCLHTSSFLFRAAALPAPLPEWFLHVCVGDLALFTLVARQGAIRRVPGVMSRWRIHSGGITNRPEFSGVRFHLSRLELWRALTPEVDERGRAALAEICDWHTAQIIEIHDQVERANVLRAIWMRLPVRLRKSLRAIGNPAVEPAVSNSPKLG